MFVQMIFIVLLGSLNVRGPSILFIHVLNESRKPGQDFDTVEDSLQNPFFVPLCRRQHYVQDSLQNLNVLLLFSRSGHLPPKLPSNFGNP